MWLVIFAISALVTTGLYLFRTQKYYMGHLSLGLWALTACVFLDHVMGWFADGAEGPFLEIGAEPLVLSICMLIPVFVAWELAVMVQGMRANATIGAEQKKDTKEEY
ncbi:MAG: hypothetical protein AB7D42_01185 [Candidatus Methanomethylophilaceae archaeon]